MVVISWIFTTFTGSTTTSPYIKEKGEYVVISWIFTTFTGSTTTFRLKAERDRLLWLAEFLLPLQGQQQQLKKWHTYILVVISWIFTTFTGSTTTNHRSTFSSSQLWLAEFLLPLQGQQQHHLILKKKVNTLWLAEFLLPLQGQQQRYSRTLRPICCCD